MRLDTTFQLLNESIPRDWVLTVRKCECGQTLYWDKKGKEWHCMRESCPLYKSHKKRKEISIDKIEEVLALADVLTIGEIAFKVHMSPRQVIQIIREE